MDKPKTYFSIANRQKRMLKIEIHLYEQKRSHRNATFKHKWDLNTKIQLNTIFMFKIGIYVFTFAKPVFCLCIDLNIDFDILV
jgi:hypothetical protein